ncbi:MAG: hypothetical protein DRP78_02015 [Candidatus Omnitrophota bacterium]|nr:MAG: hypothetical protein DRP78_02015 [Candidatus Omnitrophota bacterium]
MFLKNKSVISKNKFLKFITLVFLGVCGVVFGAQAQAADYYMATNGSDIIGDGSSGNEWQTLQYSMANMGSGDTLIIRDGVYTCIENTIDSTHKPQNGNSTDYTQIRAEHSGKVSFDGQDENNVFALSTASYISFEGIIWCNNNFPGAGTLVGVDSCNHIKFIHCGAYDAHDGDDGHVFSSYSSTDLLYEECYAWGAGDYSFMPARDTERVIYRRCVSRQDRQAGWLATTGFFAYGSRNVEFQNCIYIDADNDIGYYSARPFAWTFRYASQGFELENTNFAGCISLNGATGGVAAGSTVSLNTAVLFSNCVSMGTYQGSRLRYDGANFDHCTFYGISALNTDTWGRGVYFEGQGSNERDDISNSIIAGVTNNIALLNGVSQYNCLYNNSINYVGTSNMTGDKTMIDPLSNSLLYPLRIENNSDLDGAASDGGDIGATIFYKIGRDGTLWGEEGYNETTNESLWPFPNGYN